MAADKNHSVHVRKYARRTPGWHQGNTEHGRYQTVNDDIISMSYHHGGGQNYWGDTVYFLKRKDLWQILNVRVKDD